MREYMHLVSQIVLRLISEVFYIQHHLNDVCIFMPLTNQNQYGNHAPHLQTKMMQDLPFRFHAWEKINGKLLPKSLSKSLPPSAA